MEKEVFDWINDNLPKGSVIIELGSGEGTKLLCKDYIVFSIEHDPKFLGRNGSHYIEAPLRQYAGKSFTWYDKECLEGELPFNYDLILVDGPKHEHKMGFYYNLELFDLSVPILINDTHRDLEEDLCRNVFADLNWPEITNTDLHKIHKFKTFSVIK